MQAFSPDSKGGDELRSPSVPSQSVDVRDYNRGSMDSQRVSRVLQTPRCVHRPVAPAPFLMYACLGVTPCISCVQGVVAHAAVNDAAPRYVRRLPDVLSQDG